MKTNVLVGIWVEMKIKKSEEGIIRTFGLSGPELPS